MPQSAALTRAESFCRAYSLHAPILLAPMAGACPPALSIAVANAGGMGGAGLLLHAPDAIAAWMRELRAGTSGPVQLNLWIPDPAPARDAEQEGRVRAFLSAWG